MLNERLEGTHQPKCRIIREKKEKTNYRTVNHYNDCDYEHNSSDYKDKHRDQWVGLSGNLRNVPIISWKNAWFPLDVSLHQAIDSKTTTHTLVCLMRTWGPPC